MNEPFKRLVSLTFLLCLATLTSNAQWVQTNGPFGEFRALAISGTNVFAGGTGGVFRSSNNGSTWTTIRNGLPEPANVKCILAADTVIFAATQNGKLFRSSVNGQSWNTVPLGFSPAGSLYSMVLADTILYVGGSGGFLLRSSMPGDNWTRADTGLPKQSIYSLRYLKGTLFAGTISGGVYRSTDRGDHWMPASTGLPPNTSIRSLVDLGNDMFAATDNGVYRTTNLGQTWSCASPESQSSMVLGLARADSVLFASTLSGIFRLTSMGPTWTWTKAAGTGNQVAVYCLAVGSGIFAGTRGNGVLRSDDKGLSWKQVNVGLADQSVFSMASSGASIFAGTYAGVFCSSDGGGQWEWFDDNDGIAQSTVYTLHEYGHYIFAGMFGIGVYRYDTKSSLWTFLPSSMNKQVSYFLHKDSVLLAATWGGVYASLDSGVTWTARNTGLTDTVFSLSLAGDQIFAATAHGVYSCSISGAQWSKTNGLPETIAYSLVYSRENLLAGTEGRGLFLSKDKGGTWSKVISNEMKDNAIIKSFASVDPYLFAGTSRGVFCSKDDGASWKAIDTAISNKDVYPIFRFDSLLFAGTNGNGVWRRPLSEVVEVAAPPTGRKALATSIGTIIFSWQSGQFATKGYEIQISNSPLFQGVLLSLKTVSNRDSSSLRLNGLAYNTKYYWRVASINALGTVGEYSSPADTFSTVASVVMKALAQFPASPADSTSFRLVSCPGKSARVISTFLQGASRQGYDWRAFREMGTRPDEIMSRDAQIQPGTGIWLIRKGNFEFTDSFEMPALESDGAFPVVLQEGWNIVSIPFDRPLSIADLRLKNGSFTQPLWQFDGSFTHASDSLEPFKGYYLSKGSLSNILRLPYPFPRNVSGGAGSILQTGVEWALRLRLSTAQNDDRENLVGIAEDATLGRDKYEHEKPRILFNTSQILFCRPDWNSSYPYFDADFRNAVGEGQVWQFEVFNPSRSKSSIVFEGLEKIPTSYQIAVLNLTTMKMESIRESTRIEFQPASETTIFRLLVGYPSFVERQLDENVPATFALHQNYPNPFNPATTIKYDLPVACQVSLTIYSILGREVATVVDGWQEKGYKSFEWSAQSLSTGMYFYRLKAGEYTAVRKMVVLK